MKKSWLLLIAFVFLAACRPAGAAVTPAPAAASAASLPAVRDTMTPFPPGAPTATATAIPTPTFTPTPSYPPEGYGPAGFPSNVNPLTGLEVADPALLERRPVLVKVSNLPRLVRPQWGLSLADIVYEYYIEEGTTRFAAAFYGQNAEKVGSVRSARFFDAHLIRMYKALFVFGSADYRVRNRLYNSNFADRLILEWQTGCPALCRESPGGYDMLFANTQEISAYAARQGISNGRQNLDGMFFQAQVPGGWMPGLAGQIFVRFSSVIYNRWDYEPVSGRYYRFSDTDNDMTGGQNEVYAQLTDRLTGQSIATDNLVIILTPHQYYSLTPEIVDIALDGSGAAYAFRDGRAYQLAWQRPTADSVLSLTYADGRPFPFKPGATWFEVMGVNSTIEQNESGWRFHLRFP